MKTTAQRIARYNERMLSSLIDPVLSAVSASQQANFEAYVNDFVPNQEALRLILNGAGVSMIEIGPYEAFHGELYGLSKRVSGPTLQLAFCNLVAKWSDAAHLGAGAEALLLQIGADIYALDACGTP